MQGNETEVLDSTNETEEADANQAEEAEQIDVEALKKENETLKAQKEHWRKKAEEKSEVKAEVKPQEGPSQKDIIYIAKADIHEEDVDEVLTLAKAMKWEVKQAHEYLKPRLKEKAEQRQTAEATQIKGSPRSVTKDTPDSLISRAIKGEEIDPDKLAAARIAKKLENKK